MDDRSQPEETKGAAKAVRDAARPSNDSLSLAKQVKNQWIMLQNILTILFYPVAASHHPMTKGTIGSLRLLFAFLPVFVSASLTSKVERNWIALTSVL
jgi:hypothetical protein